MNNLANYSVTTNVNVDNLSNDRDKSFNSVYQQDFDIENNVYHVKFNDYNYEEEIYSIRDEEEKVLKVINLIKRENGFCLTLTLII